MVENVLGDVKIVLPPVLDISMVHGMQKELIMYCENRNSFRLEGAMVKKITSPAIQLIVSFVKYLSKNNKQLLVDDISPEMAETLDDFGLLELMKSGAKL